MIKKIIKRDGEVNVRQTQKKTTEVHNGDSQEEWMISKKEGSYRKTMHREDC